MRVADSQPGGKMGHCGLERLDRCVFDFVKTDKVHGSGRSQAFAFIALHFSNRVRGGFTRQAGRRLRIVIASADR